MQGILSSHTHTHTYTRMHRHKQARAVAGISVKMSDDWMDQRVYV